VGGGRSGGVRGRGDSGVVWNRGVCGGRFGRGRSVGRVNVMGIGTGRARIREGVLFRLSGKPVGVDWLGSWRSDGTTGFELLVPWPGNVAVGISPGMFLPALQEEAVVPL
jgi:hypothetical protein